MNMNVSRTPAEELANAFDLLSQPERLKILLVIGRGHACVCHLKDVLNLRQAYISQQLMLLRQSGWVITERQGRHIFYSLADARWLDLIEQAAALAEVALPDFNLPKIEGCSYSPCNKNQ